MIEAEAVVQGYNKKYVWLRLSIGNANRILTMPREFLPWGMASATRVMLQYKPETFRHDGHGYVVEGEIIKRVE
jgi:hypothetical protein